MRQKDCRRNKRDQGCVTGIDDLLEKQWHHFIDGACAPGTSNGRMREHDPCTGAPSFSIARGTAADVDLAVQAAGRSQAQWHARRPVERGRILSRIAQLIRENAALFAEVERLETGKPPP